jgi:hypothetical protein
MQTKKSMDSIRKTMKLIRMLGKFNHEFVKFNWRSTWL